MSIPHAAHRVYALKGRQVFAQPLALCSIEYRLALTSRLDQPCMLQHLAVMRKRRRAERERLLEATRAHFILAQEHAQDLVASRVSQGLEDSHRLARERILAHCAALHFDHY